MDFSKLSDERLVQYIQESDGIGFDKLIDRYQKKLLRYLRTLCRDSDSAEDIVQETFISAYKNINSFDTSRKFSSWVYRIAHNKAINELRKHKKQVSIEEVPEMVANDETGLIEKRIDRRKVRNLLNSSIDILPIRYKETIILRYFEEKSYEEISDILKIPPNTVGVRIKRGLERLKKEMDIDIEDYL